MKVSGCFCRRLYNDFRIVSEKDSNMILHAQGAAFGSFTGYTRFQMDETADVSRRFKDSNGCCPGMPVEEDLLHVNFDFRLGLLKHDEG